MTIEEARNTLKSLKQYYNDKNEDSYVGFDNEDNEALDMASRALEVVQGMEEVFLQELPELDMRDATEEERESLKRYIDSISKSTGVKFNFNEAKTALEPCGDCVSRDEALKAIDTWDKFGFSTSGCFERKPKRIDYVPYVHYDDMVYCIKNLPSVKPQRPKGKWIANSCVRRNDVYHYTVHCDKCGKIWDYTTDKKDSIPSDYCPNCGAKMEGEEC